MLRSAARVLRANNRPQAGPLSSRRRLFWGASAGAASSSAGAASTAAASANLAANHVPSVAADLLPLVFGVVLAHAAIDEEGDDERLTSPPWKVESFGGKGSGAVASRPIERGERLIAERPLCIWPNNLSEEEARRLFEAMSPTEQKVFMDLARTEGTGAVGNLDDIRAKRATNGFSIPLLDAQGASKGVAGMVFPKIARLIAAYLLLARINHSCAPNCAQAMNYSTLRMEVYSVTDIPQSSELSIEYLPGLITSSAAERRQQLRTHFGFDACLCPVCSASPDDVARSDARRREIKAISQSFRYGGGGDRKAKLAGLQRIQDLLTEEGYKGLPDFVMLTSRVFAQETRT
ncbi:hypothetical protein B0A53_04485 [Rhodotorula sp. CCFEE 5036]|nr:hypothetical protein B0A53_04485 [Rhodotorula sp. CCFEE 5036]